MEWGGVELLGLAHRSRRGFFEVGVVEGASDKSVGEDGLERVHAQIGTVLDDLLENEVGGVSGPSVQQQQSGTHGRHVGRGFSVGGTVGTL